MTVSCLSARLTRWFATACLLLLVGCAPPASEVLVLDGIDLAEVRLGGGCRTVAELAPLIEYLEEIPADWQAFWKEPPSSPFLLTLASDRTPRLRVGITDGSMIVERAGASPRFRAVSEAEASRLVELVGGVPLGDELESCLLAGQPLVE